MAFLGGGDGVTIGDGGVQRKTQPLGKTSKNDDNRIEREVDTALMGTSRLPDGVEVKSSEQVSFSDSDVDGKYDQVGLVVDVVQELKEIFNGLGKTAGDKKDFFRMLLKLKEEYGPLGGHPSVGALTGFIVERAPFHLTADEIDNLWY